MQTEEKRNDLRTNADLEETEVEVFNVCLMTLDGLIQLYSQASGRTQ